ncbi:50S ribosome-binding GTPase family protein [Theileria parva strain Muguga]|uniref:EngB-type G domain-containing protein n=1 Tax=Theileria parva TaxID=5875 RepID=Q4N0V8_THEPA|nr:50S ribosome-binding GTPase family protein [Theileria parva strain Muguga]EAN30866.1 50S ribosome-binding GTPase family protein [Theileria parva strain Muguga]|eukprot:XP_763149.1 hypothetical protein [Theileria parva strain Muguga]
MLLYNRFLLSKFEPDVVKINFSKTILNNILSNSIGNPTTRDEIIHYKRARKLNKLSPLIFNRYKPKVKLLASTLSSDSFPRNQIPEICIFGASKSGKSSLLNAILNKPNLSKVQFKTNKLHFFQVGGSNGIVMLVDMPNCIKQNKPDENLKNEKILEICLNYLKYRENLVLTIIIIDSLKGITSEDLHIINFCNHNRLNFLVVLNKSDLFKPVELTKKIQTMETQLNSFKYKINNIVPVSSTKLQNINQLHQILTDFINNTKSNTDSQIATPKGTRLPKIKNINTPTNNLLDQANSVENDLVPSKEDDGFPNEMCVNTQIKPINLPNNDNVFIKLNININDLVKASDDSISNTSSLVTSTSPSPASEVDEMKSLFDAKCMNALTTKYRVNKLKLNTSYKRIFKLYRSKQL